MLKVGDIVLITPQPDEDEKYFEKEETWGCCGEVMKVLKSKVDHPYEVYYVPWVFTYGLCSYFFKPEELEHLSKMSTL